MDKPSVAITGVHVRSPRPRVIEVFVEVDGKWRRVFRGTAGEFIDGEVSEFVEVAGIERAKVVEL